MRIMIDFSQACIFRQSLLCEKVYGMNAGTHHRESFLEHSWTSPFLTILFTILFFLGAIFYNWVKGYLHNEELRAHFVDQQIKNLVIQHNISSAPCFLRVSTLTKEQLMALTDRWPSWESFKVKHPEDCKDPVYPIKELF